MSIFDVSVSYFKNVFEKPENPRPISLASFLKSEKKEHFLALAEARKFHAEITAQEGTKEHKIQKEKYRQAKAKMPAATIGGITRFVKHEGSKSKTCEILEYSGFMQLDIDGKDNPHFTVDELFNAMTTLPHAAYVGRSVSGKGLFALLRISDPEEYALHYMAALEGLKRFNIQIDPNANSPVQLRIISPDPNAYFNESAPVFTHKAKFPEPVRKPKKQRKNSDSTSSDTEKKDPAEICIEYINKNSIDVTKGWIVWLRIGSALYFEYGSEKGREYFHTVSQFHDEYDEENTDAAFDSIEKHRKETSINYFLKVCKTAGISVKNILKDKAAEKRPPSIRPTEVIDPETGEILSDKPTAHPYGQNPYTKEIFDERGYPEAWDEPFSDTLEKESEAGAILY